MSVDPSATNVALCTYCEGRGCDECGGNGKRVTTVVNGTVIHGNRSLDVDDRAALETLVDAAREDLLLAQAEAHRDALLAIEERLDAWDARDRMLRPPYDPADILLAEIDDIVRVALRPAGGSR